MLVFAVLVISVVLPLYIIYWLSNGKTVNKSQLLVKTAASGLFIYTFYLFNNWTFTSHYLRYLFLILFLLATGYSWWKVWNQPWRSRLDIRQWAPVLGGIILMTICGLMLVNITGAGEIPDNHVQIECEEGFYILLAHLKLGSLVVSRGDRLKTGDHIGSVGNSGNTTEPYLYIHAQTGPGGENLLDADPLPMVFRNLPWLKRNDVVGITE